MNLVGQTDGNGVYVTTGMEQTGWIGNYTQIWFVGNTQASPALTFFVGQLGTGGTLTSTDIGQTSDGSVTGTSIVSVANGTVSTYSATELDYTASLYYDVQTVGTLYQAGIAIKQGVSAISTGKAGGGLNAPALNWNDHDLQTDHYVVAFLFYNRYFQNPFYFSEGGCEDANSDCTIGGEDGIPLIEVASIYLGSTLADQTSIPQDGTVPPLNDALYDNFLATSQPPYPTGAVFKTAVIEWLRKLQALGLVLAVADSTASGHQDLNAHPIRYLLELKGPPDGDVYRTFAGARLDRARYRTYYVKNSNGHFWGTYAPLAIKERFLTKVGPGSLPASDGCWYKVKGCEDNENRLEFVGATITDHYGLGLLDTLEVGFLQFYYATGFTPPSALAVSGFTLPSVSEPGLAVPLLIKDQYNSCAAIMGSPVVVSAAQPVRLALNYSGIYSDNGPPVDPYRSSPPGCAPPTQ